MLALATVVLLSQSIRLPGRSFDQVQALAEMTEKFYADQAAANAQFEREEFLHRYSRLVKAMREFSEAYNASRGHVLPLKKMVAINKAYEALQKTESWKQSLVLTPVRGPAGTRASFMPPEPPRPNQ